MLECWCLNRILERCPAPSPLCLVPLNGVGSSRWPGVREREDSPSKPPPRPMQSCTEDYSRAAPMPEPPKHHERPLIAFFLPTLDAGGVARVMINLARGFLDRGHRVDMVAASASGALRDQVPEEARLVDLGSKRVVAAMPGLIRYLRRERPFALVAGMTHCSVVALCARKAGGVKTKVIATEHVQMSAMRRDSRRTRVRAMPLLARYFLPWADAIVAVSNGVADDVSDCAGIPRERIQVIYNPVVGPALFLAAKAEPSHPWFKAGAPPVILSVGQLTQLKSHEDLLSAFAVVARERPARLLILGEGPLRGKLENL